MNIQNTGRRAFFKQSALAAGAAVLPMQFALGATLPAYSRPEWQTFKTSSHYNALLYAIGTMKANTNSADPKSWNYWTNAHVNRCPHGVPYFLAWHRGYLFYFEKQLRAVSGDSALVLPYWDYYSYSTLPAEFTDPRTGNPLYVNRVNTNVYQALTMYPFSSSLTNFQRGMPSAFEPAFESGPHNPVHNIIGAAMATMSSPVDPIFWLHHANVDRLWVAWTAAGGGRAMPPKWNTYWSGTHIYTNTLSISRGVTYDTRTWLNYAYDKEVMPARLPPLAQAGRILRVSTTANSSRLTPPPVGTFALSDPRATGGATFSAGGALRVGLDERSISVQLPVAAEFGRAMAQIARGNAASAPGTTTSFKSVYLVLDDLQLTPGGRNGGYFYKVFLNLPRPGDTYPSVDPVQIGTLGPFEIAGAAHHAGGPARLRYVVTNLLSGLSPVQIGMLTVSFVRVDGENRPSGPAVGIGEVRIELSTEDAAS